jgi:copper homeostasis protein
LEDIIDCGFSRILTSGQKFTANDGIENINLLIKKTKGRISIMPGGGVRSSNIAAIMKATGCKEIHSAAINKSTLKIEKEEIIKMKELF